jgi:hyaluronan synthase
MIGIYFFSAFCTNFLDFNAHRMQSHLAFSFVIIAPGLGGFKLLFFLFKAYNYDSYKPVASVTDEVLPCVTAIMPAYYEGKNVWGTLIF